MALIIEGVHHPVALTAEIARFFLPATAGPPILWT